MLTCSQSCLYLYVFTNCRMAFHEHQVQTNRTLDFELCHHARLPCAGSYRTPLASLYLLEGAQVTHLSHNWGLFFSNTCGLGTVDDSLSATYRER